MIDAVCLIFTQGLLSIIMLGVTVTDWFCNIDLWLTEEVYWHGIYCNRRISMLSNIMACLYDVLTHVQYPDHTVQYLSHELLRRAKYLTLWTCFWADAFHVFVVSIRFNRSGFIFE